MNVYNTFSLEDGEKYAKRAGKNRGYSELSEFDLSFLLGMIKEKRPRKIVEVGISAGGTTAIVLDYLNDQKMDTEMYSLDLSEKFYRDSDKQSGFVAEDWKNNNQNNIRHSLLLGKVLAERVREICSDGKADIDFLFLDTTHSLPGEVLDFLCGFPFLSDHATVVLHDVNLCHMDLGAKEHMATKVLFDAVSADKYFGEDYFEEGNICNIAAFSINADTGKYIRDVFSILGVPWAYFPDDDILAAYEKTISEQYDEELIRFFRSIVKCQERSFTYYTVMQHYHGEISFLEERWRRCENHIYIYGAGYWGRIYYRFALSHGLSVHGIIVSDDQVITEDHANVFNVPIKHLSDVMTCDEGCMIVMAVSGAAYGNCVWNLKNRGFFNVL